jgi:hypothetical protein
VNDSKRIADLRVSKMTIVFVRYVYPAVIRGRSASDAAIKPWL